MSQKYIVGNHMRWVISSEALRFLYVSWCTSGKHSDRPAHPRIPIGVFVMRCIYYRGSGVGVRSLIGQRGCAG